VAATYCQTITLSLNVDREHLHTAPT
jgi:hypothetical protein